jgi:nucleoside-diphosphate-sugar epimerase
MKVLVTGHRGYIGPHLVNLLKDAGHHVTGVDINYFGGCEWESLPCPDQEWIKDFKDLTIEDLKGFDCIMHLAAISNDPMGDLDEGMTYRINREGSLAFAKCAKKAGVSRFLFSSSCSIYGKGEKLDLDEDASFNPVSAYAVSKVAMEEGLEEMADENFCPVYLRNSTAYGNSPMLRIDLVVNNLLACAIAKGDIRIMSDGTPWRPLVHCKDIAHAFVLMLNAPREKVFNKAFNIGGNEENYQVKDVADLVKRLVPEAKITFTGEVGADPRNYRVNFDRLYTAFPEFKLEYTLKKGMEELFHKFKEHKFNEVDFDSSQFVRLRTLKKYLEAVAV